MFVIKYVYSIIFLEQLAHPQNIQTLKLKGFINSGSVLRWKIKK